MESLQSLVAHKDYLDWLSSSRWLEVNKMMWFDLICILEFSYMLVNIVLPLRFENNEICGYIYHDHDVSTLKATVDD